MFFSRLVYTPGHVQADEGEEEVDNEHLKRYITTRRSLDPVFTLPLPTYFRNQVGFIFKVNILWTSESLETNLLWVFQVQQLEAQVGSVRFQDLMQTVDNETLEMMRDFLNSHQVLQSPQSWFIHEMIAIINLFSFPLLPSFPPPSKENKKKTKKQTNIQIRTNEFLLSLCLWLYARFSISEENAWRWQVADNKLELAALKLKRLITLNWTKLHNVQVLQWDFT